MAITDYSFQFGSYAFGAGTFSPVTEIEGLESIPELRTQDDNRGYNDGAFSGRDFYNGRTMTFSINTFAGGGRSAQQNYELLQNSLIPQQTGTTAFVFKLSPTDSEKTIQARVRQLKTKVDPDFTYGFIKSQVVFFCPDPRYYDNTVLSATIPTPSTLNGRTYNRVYPLSFGGGASSLVTINNAGRIYTSPTITVTGPVTVPVIGTLESGNAISTNVIMNLGDTLVIDTDQKLVTLNGASVRNLVTAGSNWFVADPGSTTFTFTASGGTTGATTATISYSNAYV